MDIVSIIVTLILVALVLYAVWYVLSKFILPRIPEPFNTIIVVLFWLVVILVLLGLIGIGPGTSLGIRLK